MCSQHDVTLEMEREAQSRLFELIDAADLTIVMAELNTWLQQNPAHRLAWARARQIARMTAAYLRATDPGAGKEQMDRFVDAIEDERRLREELKDPVCACDCPR